MVRIVPLIRLAVVTSLVEENLKCIFEQNYLNSKTRFSLIWLSPNCWQNQALI